jgi:hypothetical protein
MVGEEGELVHGSIGDQWTALDVHCARCVRCVRKGEGEAMMVMPNDVESSCHFPRLILDPNAAASAFPWLEHCWTSACSLGGHQQTAGQTICDSVFRWARKTQYGFVMVAVNPVW